MTNAHNLQLSITYTISNINGSQLEAPTVANGIDPTLIRSSIHNMHATICPRPLGSDIHRLSAYLEFEAVIVLPEITQNYGIYRYGNYVGNVPRR